MKHPLADLADMDYTADKMDLFVVDFAAADNKKSVVLVDLSYLDLN